MDIGSWIQAFKVEAETQRSAEDSDCPSVEVDGADSINEPRLVD